MYYYHKMYNGGKVIKYFGKKKEMLDFIKNKSSYE